MRDRPSGVLFRRAGRSARSTLAEMLRRKDGAGGFDACSGESAPKGEANPRTWEGLAASRDPSEDTRSTPRDGLATPGAPVTDFVLSVCDEGAAKTCPVRPGQPMAARRGIEDPSREDRGEMGKRAAFAQAVRSLRNRMSAFTALPVEGPERTRPAAPMREIGGRATVSFRRPDVA